MSEKILIGGRRAGKSFANAGEVFKYLQENKTCVIQSAEQFQESEKWMPIISRLLEVCNKHESAKGLCPETFLSNILKENTALKEKYEKLQTKTFNEFVNQLNDEIGLKLGLTANIFSKNDQLITENTALKEQLEIQNNTINEFLKSAECDVNISQPEDFSDVFEKISQAINENKELSVTTFINTFEVIVKEFKEKEVQVLSLLSCKDCERKEQCKDNKEIYRHQINNAIDELIKLAKGQATTEKQEQYLKRLMINPTKCDRVLEKQLQTITAKAERYKNALKELYSYTKTDKDFDYSTKNYTPSDYQGFIEFLEDIAKQALEEN